MGAIRNKNPITGYSNRLFGIDYNVLVSHRHGIQLAKVPKNASSFFRHLFLINHPSAVEFNASKEPAHVFNERIRNKNIPVKKKRPVRNAEYMTCVVLRDPLSRMVSAYLDRIVKKIGTGARDEPRQRFYYDVSKSAGKEVTSRNITFNNFLTYAVSCPDYRRDKHYRTQISFFRHYSVDLFSTTEELSGLFSLMERRGMKIPEQSLSHPKKTRYERRGSPEYPATGHLTASQLKSRSGFPSPRTFYSEQTVQMLLSEYTADIDLYCRVREIPVDTLVRTYIDA